MAYQITFTKRFEKHFKDLNTQEKKQLIWYYESDKLIILIDVGHHNILDQY